MNDDDLMFGDKFKDDDSSDNNEYLYDCSGLKPYIPKDLKKLLKEIKFLIKNNDCMEE